MHLSVIFIQIKRALRTGPRSSSILLNHPTRSAESGSSRSHLSTNSISQSGRNIRLQHMEAHSIPAITQPTTSQHVNNVASLPQRVPQPRGNSVLTPMTETGTTINIHLTRKETSGFDAPPSYNESIHFQSYEVSLLPPYSGLSNSPPPYKDNEQ